MGLYDEVIDQCFTSLMTWDFASAFPGGYNGTKAPLLVDDYPMDLIDNMLAERALNAESTGGAGPGGQMTQPIISVQVVHDTDMFRSLGGIINTNAPGGKTRFGTRAEVGLEFSCWADQQLGGLKTAERIASHVRGWAFENRIALPSFRNLRAGHPRETQVDRPQLFRFDINLWGDTVISYDR